MILNKKSQQGVFIGIFALATLVVISLAVGFMSNRVNELLIGQSQMISGKQAYWSAYSGLELLSGSQLAVTSNTGTKVYNLAGGTITTVGVAHPDDSLHNNEVRTSTVTSTGADANSSRELKYTLYPVYHAIVFDGVDDFVSHSMDLATSVSASISTWFIKKGGDGSKQHLVMLDDAQNQGYGTHLLIGVDNKLLFSIQDFSEIQNPSIKSSGTYTANSLWYHVVATWNKSNEDFRDFKIYVNGVDVTNGGSFNSGNYATNFALNIDEGTIGADNRTGTPAEFFNGLIDEVAIWNVALSAAQIRSLYIQGRSFLATNILNSNLVGYWNFNDGSNTTDDVSSNDNKGTVSSATFTGT